MKPAPGPAIPIPEPGAITINLKAADSPPDVWQFDAPLADEADLVHALQGVWDVLCHTYDLSADLPGLPVLLQGADLSLPRQTAETVLANMLSEIVEEVGRFSPWYRRSASAFGLQAVHDPGAPALRWALTREAIRVWKDLLRELSAAVRQNRALIQAADLLDELAIADDLDDPGVLASCGCVPPRVIRARQTLLISGQIVCDTCGQPFRPVPDDGYWVV